MTGKNNFTKIEPKMAEILCILAQNLKRVATGLGWSDWAEIFFGGYLGAYTAMTKWGAF